MSEKPDRLLRRPPRTVPAVILGLILGTIGGLGVWVLGHRMFQDVWPPQVSPRLTSVGSTAFDSPAVIAGAVVFVVLGACFVLSALLPGDLTRRTVLADGLPGRTAVSRRDFTRCVRHRVARVDGVDSVRVSLRRNRLDVTVRTPVDDTETVLRRSSSAVDRVIDDLRPEKPVTPRVRVVPHG